MRLLSPLRIIDKINKAVGEVSSFLIYILMGMILYEVILRYLFNSPTAWAHDLSTHVFAASVVLAGGYVLLHEGHVNMDVILKRLPTRAGAILNLVTYLFFFFFCVILIWKTWDGAVRAVGFMEVTNTPAHIPIYPVKALLPLGPILLLLQGIAKYIRYIQTAITGKVPES